MAINNFVDISGNVGRNPEVKFSDNGENKEWMLFTVCINERYKNKIDNQWTKKPLWVNCVCYLPNKVTYLKSNLKEGDFVHLMGRFTINTFESKKYFDCNGNPAQIEKLVLIVEDFYIKNTKEKNNEYYGYGEPF